MKKNLNRNKIAMVLLTIIGTLTLLYFVYSVIVACSYIGSLVSEAQISLSTDFGKVIQYVMTNTFSFLFYGVTMLFMAYVVKNLPEKKVQIVHDGNSESAES